VITEGGGIPLAVMLTGGNRHDITQLLPLVEAIPPVRGRRGRPRRRPDTLYADRAYDSDKHRDQVRAKGIDPQFARKGFKGRAQCWRAMRERDAPVSGLTTESLVVQGRAVLEVLA
jgi:IS5 family transposase